MFSTPRSLVIKVERKQKKTKNLTIYSLRKDIMRMFSLAYSSGEKGKQLRHSWRERCPNK